MPRSVLIVDDDRLLRAMLGDVLREAGCNVAEAEDADVALQLLARERPGLVFLDLLMPRKSGIELLAEIHQKAPALPIYVLSSLDSPRLFEQCLAAGAHGFLVKPFHPEQVYDVVDRVFGEAA